MHTISDALFQKLHNPEEILGLIGTAEDSDLECKQWRGDEKGKRAMLAKAVCGFANGDGGVVILGMRAEGRGNDLPDIIQECAFFPNPEQVKAKALEIAQSEVEPLVQAIRASAIVMDAEGSGVVIIHVPSSDGLPHRSKQDWKFHLRSGSSTQNMPLTVLADRFGRRPPARLEVRIGETKFESLPGLGEQWVRAVDIYVENVGRGFARFPAFLVAKSSSFQPFRNPFDPGQQFIWPLIQVGATWHTFRGGVEAVVYPGESLFICKLIQRPSVILSGGVQFSKGQLKIGTICEGTQLIEIEKDFEGVQR